MDRFTLWEKGPVGGWQPAMTYRDLDQARQALQAWAEDFADEYGLPPVGGRDYRLTRDLDPGLDLRRLSPGADRQRPWPPDFPPPVCGPHPGPAVPGRAS